MTRRLISYLTIGAVVIILGAPLAGAADASGFSTSSSKFDRITGAIMKFAVSHGELSASTADWIMLMERGQLSRAETLKVRDEGLRELKAARPLNQGDAAAFNGLFEQFRKEVPNRESPQPHILTTAGPDCQTLCHEHETACIAFCIVTFDICAIFAEGGPQELACVLYLLACYGYCVEDYKICVQGCTLSKVEVTDPKLAKAFVS